MRRDEWEHVIAAAANVVDEDELVVIGSQAILGPVPNAPEGLLRSMEADIYPRNNPERAEQIDGALGDGSRFHEAYGYYAHGVGPETVKAPAGWEARLIPVRVRARPGSRRVATALCLEVHDLVLSKCAAGRPRDWEFTEECLRAGLVEVDLMLARLPDLPVPEPDRNAIREMLEGIVRRLGGAR